MPISAESVRVALTLSKQDRDLLRSLSQADRRSLSEQVAWLAEQEAERRSPNRLAAMQCLMNCRHAMLYSIR